MTPRFSAPFAAETTAAPAASKAPAPPVAAPAAQSPRPKPFWTRQISFKGSGKTFSVGASFSGHSLCLAALRNSTGAIAAIRRFPMGPSQAPGEKGFPAFLRASLDSLGLCAANSSIHAVLRSSELDLNVLSVPKLSGSKLDAAVYWTLQKEKKFAEAEYILDYVVMGPTAETREPRLDVLTCQARRADVERLREAFREAGSPLAGVTAIPNAFVGLYRLPGAPRGYTLAANIHVEPDFSAIGLYAKDRLLFSRFIRSGTGSMAEALVEHFQELSKPRPAVLGELELPLSGAASAARSPAPLIPPLDANQAQELMRHVLLGAPRPAFATADHLLSPEQMLDVLAPAIERLARQVERTLDYYASTKQARCDALHLSGDIFGSSAVAQALGAQLGFTPAPFDATAIIGAGRELAPPTERMAVAPALAAALSHAGKSINLLDNYKVRTASEAKRVVTSSLVIGLAAVLVLIGGAGLVLDRANADKGRELQRIRTQLASMGPAVDEGALMATLNRFKERQGSLREAASRLLAPAALAEISRRTPENVKVLSLVVDYPAPESAKPGATPGQTPPPAPAQGQKTAAGNGSLVIEGVVSGSKVEFDATLSRFVLNMQASPMFNLPVVDETGLKELGGGGQVLYFIMRVGVK